MVSSIATLTKSLRDKSKPLLVLLPTAQSICRNELSIFFPGKHEWLVEWLVDRLDSEPSPEGRLSPDTWSTLFELLDTQSLNLTTTSAILRKHKFVAILARTLSDAVAKYESEESDPLPSTDGATDIEMRDGPTSPTSSSATEPGSPLVHVAFCRPENRPGQRKAFIRRGQQAHELITSVFNVVEFLSTRFKKISNDTPDASKRRRLDLITPVLKCSPEVAASLVRSYLRLLYIIVHSVGHVPEAPCWSRSCQLIWNSCSHGAPDSSKLASLVSDQLLPSISKLLALQPALGDIKDMAAWFLGTYIFQPVSGSSEKKQEIIQVLESLVDTCSNNKDPLDSTLAIRSLPAILELAIDKADKDYSVRQRRQADGFVSVLLSWMLSATNAQTSIHSQLLAIAISQKVIVEEEALRTCVRCAMRDPDAVDWKLLKAIATIDLDVLLSVAEDTIFSKLSECDTQNCGEDVWLFVEQVVTASVGARDLSILVGKWLKLLNPYNESASGIWNSDRLQLSISSHVETGLTQYQIHDILTTSISPDNWPSSLIIVESILRGVSRIETIDKLRSCGVVVSLFGLLAESLPRNNLTTQWRPLRAMLRMLDIWPTLDLTGCVNTLGQALIQRINMLLAKPNDVYGTTAKELALSLTMVFILRERYCLPLEDFQAVVKALWRQSLPICAPDDTDFWDGNFDTLSTYKRVLTACSYTLIERFVPVLSQLDGTILRDFVIGFLRSASQEGARDGFVNLRSAWTELVKADSKVYENVLFKDTLFKAVVETLRSQPSIQSLLPLAVEMLTLCPLSILRKPQREAFLDLLFQYAKEPNDQVQYRSILAALNRLSRLSTNSSALATSCGSRDGLYSLFIGSGNILNTNLEAGMDLAKSVIRHLSESRHSDQKSETQLAAAIDLANDLIMQPEASSIGAQAWSYCIIQVVAGTIDNHTDLIKSRFGTLVNQLSEILVRKITLSIAGSYTAGTSNHGDLDVPLLESIMLQGKTRDGDTTKGSLVLEVRDLIEPLRAKFNLVLAQTKDLTTTTNHSLVYYGRLVCAISDGDAQQATVVAIELSKKGCYEQFQDSYILLVSRLQPTASRRLLEYVTNVYFPISPLSPPAGYMVLRDLLRSTDAKNLADPQTEPQLTFLLSQLFMAISTCNNCHAICMLLDTANILLKEKGVSMSQLNVEEALASIVVITSPLGPRVDLSARTMDEIFIPICSIFANILSNQRFRIKGRHGLVIAMLEGLLNLLFLPRISGRRKTEAEIHPRWFNGPKGWAVTKEAAAGYCRLITMFCNPSTSSVRTNRKADHLSSATVAARKAVEIHIPSLLKKYINLSLSHHLTPDVRVALTPALYAMFDVMQASTMRLLNMSLDNTGRVVFKSLYEDWSKFGKWVD